MEILHAWLEESMQFSETVVVPVLRAVARRRRVKTKDS
jgi:hypothetical protein